MALELPRSSEIGNYVGSNDQTLLENDTKTKIPIQSMGVNATENQNTQEQHAEDNEVLFIIVIRFCNEPYMSARLQDQIAIFYCPSMYHSREITACIRRRINA